MKPLYTILKTTRYILTRILLCLVLIWGISCSKSYETVIKEELGRQVRYDSLFHDVYFEMPRKHFLEHAYEMNQCGIFFAQGSGEIKIDFQDDFKYPVEFVFFPNFESEVISGLSGSFYYTYWNGFNREFWAIKLQLDLLQKMEDWYGGRPFIKIPGPDLAAGHAYAKIDGNRLIMLWNNIDNRRVMIMYSDLTKEYNGFTSQR